VCITGTFFLKRVFFFTDTNLLLSALAPLHATSRRLTVLSFPTKLSPSLSFAQKQLLVDLPKLSGRSRAVVELVLRVSSARVPNNATFLLFLYLSHWRI
jgi:hypothetical protein